MTEIGRLLSLLPEHYQDVHHDGKLWPGRRTGCEKRWALIRPRIKPESVVVDIGSAQGYFTRAAADVGAYVLSVDERPANVALQQYLFHRRADILICRRLLTAGVLAKLSRCCFVADTILCLSVLHHVPDPVAFLTLLSSLAPEVILEFPSRDEAGGVPVRKVVEEFYDTPYLQEIFEHVELLGRTPSHLGPHQRPIYSCRRRVERSGLRPYLSYPIMRGNVHNVLVSDGGWKVDGRDAARGFNLWDLLQLGLVQPSRVDIKNSVRAAYARFPAARDVRLWNILLTRWGPLVIDKESPDVDLAPQPGDLDSMDAMLDAPTLSLDLVRSRYPQARLSPEELEIVR